MSEQPEDEFESMLTVPAVRLCVSTVTCRRCGRIVAQTIPRTPDPDDTEGEQPVMPDVALGAECPYCPPNVGDPFDLPLLWSLRIHDVTDLLLRVPHLYWERQEKP